MAGISEAVMQLTAKMMALQIVLEGFLVATCKGADDPVAAAAQMGELLRKAIVLDEETAEDPTAALRIETELNAIFDRVAGTLRGQASPKAG